jgi:CubicO group peptidase (beta-lactamase class C family)
VVQHPGQPRQPGGGLIARSIRSAVLAPLLAALVVGQVHAADTFPRSQWERLSPTQSGWSDSGLAEARKWSEQIHSTAVMVVHHGVVVGEWGDTVKRTELASIRKSVLDALIGIAVAEHKISLDSTLGQLGIDDNPPSLTDIEKTATVRILLQARSGVYHPALYETAAMAARRPPRGSPPPGTFFYYNNWDFNALGTIYEHATGTGIYDALDRQIAKPIGMQDYRPSDGKYFTGPDSIHRAYPIRMSARDLARFALLYLRNGAWEGRQIVPAAWVAESTRSYSDLKEPMGYGYLWWTAPREPAPGLMGKDWFAAIGAGGQYAFVFPALDLVAVSRVDRDLRLPQPKFSDVAELLRLIAKAGHLDTSKP